MKIIFTVHSYYPNKDGVQAVTRYLAEGLERRGHNIIVITHEIQGTETHCYHNNIEIYRVNANTVHTINRGDKERVQKLICDLSSDADAIINVCTQTALTDWTFPLLEKIHCKKILYLHGIIETKFHKSDFSTISIFAHKIWNRYRTKAYYFCNKKYLKKYDIVTQLHKCDEGYIFFENKLGIKSKVIENAADNTFFNRINDKPEDFPSKYIVFVANYMQRKNQGFVMKAFYESDLKDYALIFIGSEKNEYFNRLVQMKKALDEKKGFRDVRILTGVPREQVQMYVRHATIYALGSLWEAFPISIVESMAAGVPFISTNVGITKYLPGGVIVNSVNEMCYWFETFANNTQVASGLGETGRLYAVKNLTIDSKVLELERLIKGNADI